MSRFIKASMVLPDASPRTVFLNLDDVSYILGDTDNRRSIVGLRSDPDRMIVLSNPIEFIEKQMEAS